MNFMKRPDAITVIMEDNSREKIWPLAASEMIYVGWATTKKLAKYGVYTIGDIAKRDPGRMRQWLGINGLALWNFASGLDNSRVMHREFESPVKSVGHGITRNKDVCTEEEAWLVLLALSQDIGHRLRIHGLAAGGFLYKECRLVAQVTLLPTLRSSFSFSTAPKKSTGEAMSY